MTSRISRILLLAALTLTAACADSAGDATADFYTYVDEGKNEKAFEMMTGQSVAMLGRDKMIAMMADQTSKYQEKGGIDDIEVLSEEIEGNTAVVKVRLKFGNEQTSEETMKLVKIDGDWKIRTD